MARPAVRQAKSEPCRADEIESLLQIHSHILSNVCHEFRSMLTAVQGYTKRVLEERSGPINDEQRADLTVVQENTRRLLDLASHSLPFVAEQRLRIEPLDLREIWQQVTRRMGSRLPEKAIAMREEIPTGALMVTGDRARLETAFDIVLAKAIEWSPDGGGITAQLRRGSDGEVTAKVVVAGVKLPSQLLDKVFEHKDEPSLAEADPDRPRLAGLSLAHDLIWLYGGRLAVRSIAGEGTVFAITLPAPADGPAERTPS
jgi:signal transduction histidine kinase